MSQHFRTERDSMGAVEVPASALYGAQTQRAVENFPISRLRFGRAFLRALGMIKSAAARINSQLGVLSEAMAAAIAAAADEVAAPAGRHIAAAETAHRELLPAMDALRHALEEKSRQFWNVLKIGRTHLPDAVPMRVGQEFSGYARQVELCRGRIAATLDGVYELPLGGTAVGSGMNAPPGFASAAIQRIAETTGLPFREAEDHFEAQATRDGVAFLSAALKTYALALTNIANDIRWAGSGPRCGMGELRLPEVQPGSSIMPGKVNPVIAESLLMVCAQVIGHDAAISWSCAAGSFELNTMMPLMAYDLLESIELLAAGSRNFAEKCIARLEVNEERLHELMEQSLALCTALTPEIGYDRAAELAKKASASGRTIREVAQEESDIPAEKLARLLDPLNMIGRKP